MDIQSLRFSDNLLLYYTYIFGLFVGSLFWNNSGILWSSCSLL
jgi:hypothetical protein